MISKTLTEYSASAAPLGLDEPSPFLVWTWQTHYIPMFEINTAEACFLSEEDARKGRVAMEAKFGHLWEFLGADPFRMPIDDLIRLAKGRKVYLMNGQLQVIETF